MIRCSCGKYFNIPEHQVYLCKCGYHGTGTLVDDASPIMIRRARVLDKVRRAHLLRRSIRPRAGEGLGSVIDRLERRAREMGKLELADSLNEILETCGCNRQIAIEKLNL